MRQDESRRVATRKEKSTSQNDDPLDLKTDVKPLIHRGRKVPMTSQQIGCAINIQESKTNRTIPVILTAKVLR